MEGLYSYINMNLNVVGWEGLDCVDVGQGGGGVREPGHEISGCVKFGIS
jgi:hypothetical protein